eukprot:7387956-Prymnesium_polylepis.1
MNNRTARVLEHVSTVTVSAGLLYPVPTKARIRSRSKALTDLKVQPRPHPSRSHVEPPMRHHPVRIRAAAC